MKPNSVRPQRLSWSTGFLCFLLLSLNACFLFGGSKKETVEMGDGTKQVVSKGAATTIEVGQTLKNAGQFGEALRVYKEALARDTTAYIASRALEEIGNIYIETQDYDQALEYYEQLLSRFPTYDKAAMVQKRVDFARAAREVRDERLRVAKEGPANNP
jgi:tetratricopeptide (TPR) repeat protein